MEIQHIILRHVKMELLEPFTTSIFTETHKEFILVEILGKNGLSGWAESVASPEPYYKEETLKTNWHIMEDYLIPLLLQHPVSHPSELQKLFEPIRGNSMAKAALEGAMWDLYARSNNEPLWKALGGTKETIDVGVSLGIKDSEYELLKAVEKNCEEGYKRIKLKVKPGWDLDILKAVRTRFPDISLMADANSAYTLGDIDHLKAFDEFNLTMIEQPLAYDDIIDHAKLQRELQTPLCLDESIYTLDDARHAIALGSCKIINIKIGRVGGLYESKQIHDLCKEHGIPVWCGGMLEAGVGRAHNVAITTLDNFTLPGDTSASSRYFLSDITDPAITVENGVITVPTTPGIGFEPNRKRIEERTHYSKLYKL
ncbi:o-succinylbenzoate synthase [Priestia flexa]|uniref:o-succinylbenzoate synthase n=1 Tax=Priestia flexa TaxID=86664 RepID=UPI002E2496B0|nr:o-succinylbenzoate synthase [Priestia flexa]MED3822450.1 o-succinylbenzoate synthase [Priestia flexa]